jgi:biopolymer transport protein ExbB/TolQ
MIADVMTMVAMFALRLGVPLVGTIVICRVLDRLSVRRAAQLAQERKLRQKAVAQAQQAVRTLHCWEIKRCDPETRDACPAHQRQNLPCWLALQLAGVQLSAECHSCAMYDLRKVA